MAERALCSLITSGLGDQDGDAVRALGEVGERDGIVTLVTATSNSSPAIVAAAAEALLRMIERGHVREVANQLPMVMRNIRGLLGTGSDDTVKKLMQRMEEVLRDSGTLPLPSYAPEADGASLPRPATGPNSDSESLPRAVEG